MLQRSPWLLYGSWARVRGRAPDVATMAIAIAPDAVGHAHRSAGRADVEPPRRCCWVSMVRAKLHHHTTLEDIDAVLLAKRQYLGAFGARLNEDLTNAEARGLLHLLEALNVVYAQLEAHVAQSRIFVSVSLRNI